MKKRKSNAKPEPSGVTAATSKRTVEIGLTARFRERVRELSREQRREIGQALDAIRDGFGVPHRHSGLGVRRLRGDIFECRAGLSFRLVFSAERGELLFHFAGNHDEIRDFIKTL